MKGWGDQGAQTDCPTWDRPGRPAAEEKFLWGSTGGLSVGTGWTAGSAQRPSTGIGTGDSSIGTSWTAGSAQRSSDGVGWGTGRTGSSSGGTGWGRTGIPLVGTSRGVCPGCAGGEDIRRRNETGLVGSAHSWGTRSPGSLLVGEHGGGRDCGVWGREIEPHNEAGSGWRGRQ
jgi:hypothetical protein